MADQIDQLRLLSEQISDLRHDIDRRFAQIDRQFAQIDHRFAQVDAKLDAKPGFGALYQAVATLAFGIGAVITSTVVVLKSTGHLP
jgi:hypothetical protein